VLGGFTQEEVFKQNKLIVEYTEINSNFKYSPFTYDIYFKGGSGYISRLFGYGWGLYVASPGQLAVWVDTNTSHRSTTTNIAYDSNLITNISKNMFIEIVQDNTNKIKNNNNEFQYWHLAKNITTILSEVEVRNFSKIRQLTYEEKIAIANELTTQLNENKNNIAKMKEIQTIAIEKLGITSSSNNFKNAPKRI
jgi:hypothetical protein